VFKGLITTFKTWSLFAVTLSTRSNYSLDNANNGLFLRSLKTAEVLLACRRVVSSNMNLRFGKNYNDRILGDWAKGGSGWGIAEKNRERRYSDILLAR